MSAKIYSDASFTVQVKALLDKIYGHSIFKDSVIDRAITFFKNEEDIQQEIKAFTEKIASLEKKLPSFRSKNFTECQRSIKRLSRRVVEFNEQVKLEQEHRHQHLLAICYDVIKLSEAKDFNECIKKSAQLLGTIQLLSPTEGDNVATNNVLCKPLYKAILCLRLLDRLCLDATVAEPYIKPFLKDISPDTYQKFESSKPKQYQKFVSMVKVPVLMAAILQDIGHYHPDAQAIVNGKSGRLDPFRTLEIDERKALLQINYRETIRYINEGIGGVQI